MISEPTPESAFLQPLGSNGNLGYMPDYRWETAQSQKSGSYWRPKYVPGTIGKDLMSSPGYWVNGAGVQVDPKNPSSWYMLPGGVSAAGQPGVPSSVTGATSSSTNPFSTISNVKSPAIQSAIDKALADWDSSRTNYGNALAKFTAESDTSRASARSAIDQEAKSVGGYFTGDVQTKLDSMLAGAKAANELAAQTARDEALKAYKTAGLAGSSDIYRNRMIDAALQGIRAQQAQTNAAQELANYQWLSAAQRGLLGQRAAAESAWVDTGLKPLTAGMAVNQNVLDALGKVNAANLANNFYGVNAPYYPSVYGALPVYGGGYGGTNYPAVGGYYPSMRPNVSAVPNAVRNAVPANLGTTWPYPAGIEVASALGGNGYYPVGGYTGPNVGTTYPMVTQQQGADWLNQYLYGPSAVTGLYPGTTNEWGDLPVRSAW